MKVRVIPRKYLTVQKSQNSLSPDEKKIFAILEDDQKFEEDIKKIRNNCKIPQGGFNPEEYRNEGVENYILRRQIEVLEDWNEDLSKKYRGTLSWYVDLLQIYYEKLNLDRNSLFCLILFNFILPSVFPSDIRILSEIELQKQLKELPNVFESTEDSHYAYIEISHKVQKTELLNFVKDHYNELTAKLGEVNRRDNRPLMIKVQNIEIYKKIHQLRLQGKSFSEIADIISEDPKYSRSDSEIRVMYSRYQKLIKSLRSKK